MNGFLSRKLLQPLLGFLKQGVAPEKLALAVSLGILLAIVPVFGTSTVLCLLVIWLFRLNPAATLLVNQFAYPLQFALYLPFIRIGEWLFHAPKLPFSIEQIFSMLTQDLYGAIQALWWSTVYALVAWVAASIPALFLMFLALKRVFLRLSASINKAARSEIHTR